MFGTAIIGAGSHALLKTLSPYNRAFLLLFVCYNQFYL